MAISEEVTILEHQLFVQGDARDPLGVWVARHQITGDMSGNPIKVAMRVTAAASGGRIYTAYDAQVAGTSGALSLATMKIRLLTNFPDADLLAGVQGYASLQVMSGFPGLWDVDTSLSAPFGGPSTFLIGPNQRFILLFGPQRSQVEVNIMELEIDSNVNNATYSFEAYGYYWDRQVVNVPGGPRHPGA